MNSVRIRLSAAAAVALVGLVTACGSHSKSPTASAPSGPAKASALETNPAGDIPDNQAFVAFRDAGGLFSVTVPEGWAQTTEAGATVFSDKYNSIRIQTRPASAPPTTESVASKELPSIAASAPGYTAGPLSMVDRKAGHAVLVSYRANSAPNSVTGKYAVEAVERYAFYRSGHEVILTLAAPIGSDNVDPWRKVTDSLTWL